MSVVEAQETQQQWKEMRKHGKKERQMARETRKLGVSQGRGVSGRGKR